MTPDKPPTTRLGFSTYRTVREIHLTDDSRFLKTRFRADDRPVYEPCQLPALMNREIRSERSRRIQPVAKVRSTPYVFIATRIVQISRPSVSKLNEFIFFSTNGTSFYRIPPHSIILLINNSLISFCWATIIFLFFYYTITCVFKWPRVTRVRIYQEYL